MNARLAKSGHCIRTEPADFNSQFSKINTGPRSRLCFFLFTVHGSNITYSLTFPHNLHSKSDCVPSVRMHPGSFSRSLTLSLSLPPSLSLAATQLSRKTFHFHSSTVASVCPRGIISADAPQPVSVSYGQNMAHSRSSNRISG